MSANRNEAYFEHHTSEPFHWKERKEKRGFWRAFLESFAYLPPFNRMFGKVSPSYAESYWYCMGGLTFFSFLLLILTGLILTFFGPTWWSGSNAGYIVKSIHYWSAQAFFFFLFLHIIRVWITGAYRGKRSINYMIGFVTFFLSLGENLFGLLARGDWESQFVSMHSDDMLFTVPILKLISPENFTSALIIHVALIPFVLVVLIGVHVALVKLQGIARPL
ncbi:cytochrome b N-terminal domain-containing protein [Fodinisporobacter ferrooxydans]|uniref:Cytochrome b N-terminal domain-containing protein n=1 Tax=Fodinisporobacter ferrooxydans TaxID=2901836 RepID=A0ABY4CP37_9BACL|nr:cytochrome b N-terminal domain-containing protein [Alicyclobacillaceae bacterium MYW30-H2]